MASTSCYVWDFTHWSREDDGIDEKRLADHLGEHCKQWAFQLEATKDGKLHWQGRMSLRSKKRLPELVSFMKGTVMEGAHWTPTSVANRENVSYVMKADTRVKGPWTHKDPKPEEEPVELKGKVLYKWQEKVVLSLKEEKDDRKVNCVIDLAGRMGKGWLRKYVLYNKIAAVIPDCNEAKTMSQFAFAFPHKGYVIDIPRARGKKHSRAELWRGIEQLKDGLVVETRYKPQMRQLAVAPTIWVFTNEVPEFSLLSEDRWCLWCVDPETNDLIRFTERRAENIAMWVTAKRAKPNVPEEEKTKWD